MNYSTNTLKLGLHWESYISIEKRFEELLSSSNDTVKERVKQVKAKLGVRAQQEQYSYPWYIEGFERGDGIAPRMIYCE